MSGKPFLPSWSMIFLCKKEAKTEYKVTGHGFKGSNSSIFIVASPLIECQLIEERIAPIGANSFL